MLNHNIFNARVAPSLEYTCKVMRRSFVCETGSVTASELITRF